MLGALRVVRRQNAPLPKAGRSECSKTEIARASKSRPLRPDPHADQIAGATRLEDFLSNATGSEIRATAPPRLQVLLDKQAADLELLGVHQIVL